jgi:hypothetical protein
MGRINNALALFLTLIIATSCLTLLIFKPANAPSPLPSTPEFTSKVVASSIEVTIKNQPLTAL